MENTAKNFAIQLGSLISLYVITSALIVLLFGIINIIYPDSVSDTYQYQYEDSGVRYSIALLLVFFPTYLILTRTINKIRRTEHATYVSSVKWLIYLSLVLSGGLLLGNLVTVIDTFLNGEITTRFIFKALGFFIVMATAFTYYLLDARNYWMERERQSLWYACFVTCIVLTTIVVGYLHIDSPKEVRERKIDQEQIQSLGDIQWRISDKYRELSKLPTSLEEVYPKGGIPSAGEGRRAFEYHIISENSFKLCAEFKNEQLGTDTNDFGPSAYTDKQILHFDNWDHEAGFACFERVIQKSPTVLEVKKEENL